MPKVPAISGEQLIALLERKGYRQIRTRGSHVRLYPPDGIPGLRKVTVPLHKRLKVGTLLNIMKDTGLKSDDLV